MIGQFCKETDRRASQDIDCECAEGELNALAELLNISAHEVAKDGAEKAAGADQE